MKRTIFSAARLHALNPRGDHAAALLVQAGRIAAVGTVAELRAFAADADVVDFGAATLTPGLTDAHIHITEWAVARTQIDLAEATSIDAAVSTVAAASRNGGFIVGRGWNPHAWGGTYPTATVLDAAVPDIPVVLQSHDMHALWLNSRALQLAGIDASTADPEGGRILRENGQPTGVLLENAAQLVVPHLPGYDAESIIPLILDAQRELHAYGITGIHSFPGVHLLDPDPLFVLQIMHSREQLRLRVLQHIALHKLDDAIRIGLRSGFGDEWLRLGGVKIFLDGALGSRTAWMTEPYEQSSDRGMEVMAGAAFRDVVRHAAENGIASVVHAIGDAAVRRAFEVLVAQAESQSHALALPHRIEHVQCLPPACAPILGKRVVCSVQPAHLMSDWQAADRHWGSRAAQAYAFRSMLDNGATLACGSDAPVESADPRHGLYAAVTRQDLLRRPVTGWQTQQRISAREALAAYTTGAAYAAGITPPLAGLAPGALADFVAWR
ncbi:MAG TPA: amidohydrolase, partial [Longimicrobiales bacterium]